MAERDARFFDGKGKEKPAFVFEDWWIISTLLMAHGLIFSSVKLKWDFVVFLQGKRRLSFPLKFT